MSSYIIEIDHLDKLRSGAKFSEIRKLIKAVETHSYTEDNGKNKSIIIPDKTYYMLMPNTIHTVFLGKKLWKAKARKSVINALRTGKNWIDFDWYADSKNAKKEILERLNASIQRSQMFIEHDRDAITDIEKRF